MSITPSFLIATAAPAGAPSAGAAFFVQMAPLLLIFVVFYFLLIRPQNRKMKEHRAQIDAIKKGDKVVTGGGLIGKVTRVDEHEVEIELAPSVKVKAVKSTLTTVLDPSAAKPAND